MSERRSVFFEGLVLGVIGYLTRRSRGPGGVHVVLSLAEPQPPAASSEDGG